MASEPTPHHDRHKLTRLAFAIVVGALVAWLLPLPKDTHLVASVLVAFIIAALAFALPMLWRMMRATPEETRVYADGIDPGASITDLIVIGSAVAALVGVGLMLLTASSSKESKVAESLIVFATVAAAWLLVHLMFAMRYARYWFNAQADSIDFNMDGPPAYSDFVYLAYTIGMSFAVSDTNLKTTGIRRIALQQAWFSYLFGTVIVASMINLLAGLAG